MTAPAPDYVRADAATAERPALGLHLGALGVVLVVLGAVFHETFAGMVAIWSNSATYTHGFAILPISLWLIWRRRDALRHLTPAADASAVPALGAAGLVWLLGSLAGINAVEQAAAVLLIPLAVWLTLGRHYLRAWLFPLVYLLLAVPFGAFLVPPLMELTADVTVALVRASGIPVYREGLYFSLPSGNWSVVEACSGQRYLIASFTLGLLFAYLNFRGLGRRLGFVLAAIVVPIAANALRAYMIVMIGHLSAMRLAVGVDHLLYGWVFFGIVMALLFWLGARFRDDAALDAGNTPDRPIVHAANAAAASRARQGGVMVAGLAAMLAWPAYAAVIERPVDSSALPAIGLPASFGDWRLTEATPDWTPSYQHLSEAVAGVYRRGDRSASVYVGRYHDQSEQRELIMWGNGLVPRGERGPTEWRVVERGRARLPGPLDRVVSTARLGRGDESLTVFYAYRVGRTFAGDATAVKWRTLVNRLTGQPDTGTIIAVAVPPGLDGDAGRRLAARAFARYGVPGES